MKMFIKKAALTLIIIIVLLGFFVVITGFMKVSDAFIGEYTVSKAGSEMTMQVGVAGSMGFIRSVLVNQQRNGVLYLDCYSAFGGLNGSIGAKGNYTIQIEEGTNVIALYRDFNTYEKILEKDSEGNWERVKLGNYIEK